MLALIVCASMFTACTQDEYLNSYSEESVQETPGIEEMVAYLVSEYGFSTEDIRITDSSLIVEGDIAFDIDGFWDKYANKNPATRAHYSYTNLVSSNHRYILVTSPAVGQTGEVPTDWLIASVNAISAWNSLNGDIQFTVYKGDPYNGCIAVAYIDHGAANNVIATADPPHSDGRPGMYVKINPNYYSSLTANQKTWAMIHELGHCIGFRHTDEGIGTLLYSGDQNTTDPTSVMHEYLLSNPTPPYFTSYDIAAYGLLYP